MSLNKVMLIGNVGRDPEVRYLEGNTKVATFTLATTERFKDRSGETRENTEWHNIVAWRQSADVAERFVRKGTSLYIEGRLRTRTWNDQQGAQHSRTEITVDNMQLLGRRSDNPANQDNGFGGAPATQPSYQQQYRAPQSAPAAAPQEPINIDLGAGSDDLPF